MTKKRVLKLHLLKDKKEVKIFLDVFLFGL